ncbi:unnamed protein product [Mytilus coruscus]|uniref:PHD-type domain-containing protein n=1 Tax=Mytilus coruscus TaxID=42192 RepID=A0A6J8DPJ6_MYTCO|nr:unnamed protein product [Mytilus coruscus]
MCDQCDLWFHIKCMTITVTSYNILSQSDDEWYCSKCQLPNFSDSFFEDDDQNQYDDNNCEPESKGMHFIHLNARSLLTKIPELQTIAFKTKAAVISVTETWFDETITNTEANIPGYTILRKDRNRCGGGVCMYIKENLAFTPMNLDEINKNDKFLCIELLLPKSKPIFVGTCYRPPQNCNFVEKFENFLSQLREDCEIILLGDLNICFKDQSGSLYKSLNELLKLFNLSQIIKEPTRITEFTASVIDHILCNNTEKISQSGNYELGRYLATSRRKIE